MVSLARWTSAHRRLVVVSWVALLLVGLGVTQLFGSRYVNTFHLRGTGSQQARDLLQSGFPAQAGDRDQVVLHARRGRLSAGVAGGVRRSLARLPDVAGVFGPTFSRDRTTALLTVVMPPLAHRADHAATERLIAAARAARSPSLQVELGGPAIEDVQRTPIGSSMLVGLGAAVVVLLLSFGSLLAMGLPIVTALGGLGVGLGLVALVSRVLPTADFSGELALMIGLGVGVDYALLVVTRYREAFRSNGGVVDDAVAVALDTAGRAVVFAGVTVVIALLGMFSLGISFLYGPALASSIAVLLVLAASLTLLPALLSRFGERIGRGGAAAQDAHGFWDRWVRSIQRRPRLAAAAATALLLLLASPVLGMRLGNTDAGNDPPSQTTRRAYDLLARGFGAGFNGPLLLVAKLPHARDATAVGRLAAALRGAPDVAAVTPPRLSADGRIATVSAYPRSSPQSAATESLVAYLRSRVVPPVERATGASVYVGGFTASQVDFAHVVASKLWVFIGSVVLLSALLLLVVFRSLLIPLQAAVMNLLSIAASLGVVVAVFQFGWGGGLFGVSGGPIQAFLPVMVFSIVFGLTMDYEVFLVSRIHEAWVHGASASEAVRIGLARTGRVVTAAAAVMVAVFASFTLAGDRTIALFGLGLASAVFIDAVVIRCLLLPAVLELCGRATWAFPRGLDRALPRLALEPPEPEPTPAPVERPPAGVF